MQNNKIESLESVNTLLRLAGKGQDHFPDELCEQIARDFDLQALVLFSVADGGRLTVLGRSSSAKKTLMRGTTVRCPGCLQTRETDSSFGLYSGAECEIQISDFAIYEACVKFQLSDTTKGFLKAARKTPIQKTEAAEFRILCDNISLFIGVWNTARGGASAAETSTTPSIINSISQELRTPANSIIGFASLLSEDNLTPLQSEYVSTIKNNAQNLLLLINDIIDAARIDSGTIKETKSILEIRPFMEEALRIFNGKADSNYPAINFEADASLPDRMFTDQQRLKYIITTLLSFFIRNSSGSRVTLKAYSPAKGVLTVRISDPGRSMPPDRLNAIFEPSLSDALRTAGNTGLGLTLAKKYTHLLNGNISAESSPDRGTSFDVSIPVEMVSEIEERIEALPAPEPGRNTVLVIEDDYATSKLLSNYLIKWGYKPTVVNSAEQTLSIIEQERFLAVIMDIVLPNTNGLELLQKIHEHPNTKSTPVIVCSVEAEQQKAFMMGAVEYFVKPIKYKFLVEVLQNYRLKKDSNILCVDDDLPTLNLVKEAIQTAGFNALAENVSANVMGLIADKNIDLAIVDLDMPDPNGFELIKQIKSNPRFARLPIVIYTGKENFQEDLKKIDGLFEDLLSKRSTNLEDLAQTINDMINRYDAPTPPQEVSKKEDVVKILLAEDYKHSQIIVTRLLKKNGFENVVVVENGLEAYENAQQQSFDLILMDMQMPVMNGFEAIEKIRQLAEYKDAPIIALTAFAMKGDREKCIDAGATDYIPKPIDSKEFIEKIKHYTHK